MITNAMNPKFRYTFKPDGSIDEEEINNVPVVDDVYGR
jgi:hypothetical protein